MSAGFTPVSIRHRQAVDFKRLRSLARILRHAPRAVHRCIARLARRQARPWSRRVVIVSNNSEYQRELAKKLIEQGDCASAYELAKQYGWEGVMEQIRFMSRTSDLD